MKIVKENKKAPRLMRPSSFFKGCLVEEVAPQLRIRNWLELIKTESPSVYAVIAQIHDYYPINLHTTVDKEPSPTLGVIEAIRDMYETIPGWSTQDEDAVIDQIAPLLAVYFEALVYCPKISRDKMPAKWDCTAGTVYDWVNRYTVRSVHTSFVKPKSTRTLSDYDIGLLVAHSIFEINPKKNEIDTKGWRFTPISTSFKLNKANRQASFTASLVHPGVEAIIKKVTSGYHVGLKLNGKCFTKQMISEATKAWSDVVDTGGVYIGYRNFMDTTLKYMSYLYSADIAGKSLDGNVLIWNPAGIPLTQWIKENSIDRLSCKWRHECITNFELLRNRIPPMRSILQRPDLVYWGVLAPGFECSADQTRGMYG